jgi:hypothetical protein
MNARQVFGVVVRTLGLVSMFYGAAATVASIITAGFITKYDFLLATILNDLVYLSLGVLLLTQSGAFVKFAYRAGSADE